MINVLLKTRLYSSVKTTPPPAVRGIFQLTDQLESIRSISLSFINVTIFIYERFSGYCDGTVRFLFVWLCCKKALTSATRHRGSAEQRGLGKP